MAAPKVYTYDQMKRGDTETFGFVFQPPTPGFDWSVITVDCAMTNVASPADNTGAAALRLNQALTVDPLTNNASYYFTLTHAESLTLQPSGTYFIEPQLKQGGTYYTTPVTGKIGIAQDYIV